MKTWLIRLLAVIGLVFMATFPAHADEPNRVRVIERSSTRFPWPKTDGSWMVWYEQGDGDKPSRIMADHFIGTKFPVLIANLTNQRFDSSAYDWDVQNTMVVWTDYRNEAWNIYAKQIYGETEIHIGAGSYPATDGERVVWVHGNEIRSRAIEQGPTTTIATIPEGRFVQQLEVQGSRVMWFELTGHLWRLRFQEGSGPATTLHEGNGWIYGYDFNNDLIVYAAYEGGVRTIFAHNLATGTRTAIASDGDAMQGPTTDGRYIVWEHVLNGGLQIDLVGYDTHTDSQFDISTFTGINSTPNLENGMLTWSRLNGDHSDIVAGELNNTVYPSSQRPPPPPMDGILYFEESGHTLKGHFKAFWEQRGGLPVFGFPLTIEFDEFNHDRNQFLDTQYVERQRFEYHPENIGTPYEVQLGLLGKDVLRAQGRNWEQFPKANPNSAHYFPETGHAIAPEFWDYWKNHGLEFGDKGVSHREALALWGYPISEPQIETNPDGDTVLTQWFERARFEYHPNNPAEYKVLLGRLGDEILTVRGW